MVHQIVCCIDHETNNEEDVIPLLRYVHGALIVEIEDRIRVEDRRVVEVKRSSKLRTATD